MSRPCEREEMTQAWRRFARCCISDCYVRFGQTKSTAFISDLEIGAGSAYFGPPKFCMSWGAKSCAIFFAHIDPIPFAVHANNLRHAVLPMGQLCEARSKASPGLGGWLGHCLQACVKELTRLGNQFGQSDRRCNCRRSGPRMAAPLLHAANH